VILALLNDNTQVLRDLHRQERQRAERYVAQDADQLRERLRARAKVRCLAATEATRHRLESSGDYLLGGLHAAYHHLGVSGAVERTTIYLPASQLEDFLDRSLSVPDAYAPNIYLHLVADDNVSRIPRDGGVVSAHVALLDILEHHLPLEDPESLWKDRGEERHPKQRTIRQDIFDP
jgi:hypothetical protein